MPRIARKDIQSNYLHLISQGINREYIFNKEKSKAFYLKLLTEFSAEYEIDILGYCIMDNHAHVIVYSNNREKISKCMHKVNMKFARKYNYINNRVGRVFRNRFFVQPIMDEMQLLNCLVYVHRNPVKSKIVNNYGDYKYSSYMEYLKGKTKNISDKAFILVFGTTSEYMTLFSILHNKKKSDAINDICDIKEETFRISEVEVIKKFEKIKSKSLNEIRKDEELLKEIVQMLRKKSQLSYRRIGELLNCSKDKVSRILSATKSCPDVAKSK